MLDRITFFDLETTGVSPQKDRIVSFSAKQTDYCLIEISDSKKSLVFNPTIPIPKEASDVHGFTNEMVLNKPTFKQYAPKIFDYINTSNVLGGYNIRKFDVPLLFEEFARCGYILDLEKFRIIDSCQIFHKKEQRDLTAAVRFYTGKTMQNAHNSDADNDASIDVLDGQMFLYSLDLDSAIELSKPKNETIDFDGKIKRNGEGVLVWSFGKNINLPIKQDLAYCDWVLSSDFSTHTKMILKQIITNKII